MTIYAKRLPFFAQYIDLICVKSNIKYLCTKYILVTRVAFLDSLLESQSILFPPSPSNIQYASMPEARENNDRTWRTLFFRPDIQRSASFVILGNRIRWRIGTYDVDIYYETIDTPKFGGCNGLISMGDTPCYWLIGIVSYQPELFFAAGYSTLVPKKYHKFSHRCYVVWPAMVIECHRTTWSVSAACCEGSWINAPKSGQLQRCCWWFFGFPRVTNCSANDIQSHPCML